MTPYDPSLIVTADNWRDVVQWAISAGHPAASVHCMSAPQLANLYHEQGARATVREACARAVVATLELMGDGPIDEELVRYLARDEINKHGGITTKLEVSSPRGTVAIEGLQHYKTGNVIKKIARGHAVMMVGPAGSGKTTICENSAKAINLPYYITSVVNDTHELIGFTDGHGRYHGTPFRSAFEHGGVWCGDEIDAWDAAALLVANSALANGLCTFPDLDQPLRRHADFRVVCTANTFGTGADRVYVGRNELDAASLDRFAVVEIDYDLELERMFANGSDKWLEHVWSVRKKVNDKKIRHVVSSRAIRFGAEALADGDEWDDVCNAYLFKGMSSADRSKVS